MLRWYLSAIAETAKRFYATIRGTEERMAIAQWAMYGAGAGAMSMLFSSSAMILWAIIVAVVAEFAKTVYYRWAVTDHKLTAIEAEREAIKSDVAAIQRCADRIRAIEPLGGFTPSGDADDPLKLARSNLEDEQENLVKIIAHASKMGRYNIPVPISHWDAEKSPLRSYLCLSIAMHSLYPGECIEPARLFNEREDGVMRITPHNFPKDKRNTVTVAELVIRDMQEPKMCATRLTLFPEPRMVPGYATNSA